MKEKFINVINVVNLEDGKKPEKVGKKEINFIVYFNNVKNI